jgi:hypothetical protein
VLVNWNDAGGLGDFNQDGIVNLTDLMMVIDNWSS